MSFIGDLTAIKAKTKTDITQSQLIFNETLSRSKVNGKTADYQYDHIYDILDARDKVYSDIKTAGIKIDVSVTGKVTESICEIGLKAAANNRYSRLPKTWDWVGDFAVLGSPFNLFVSVKSYKAKERLIVSGTGQNAAPVIGYGLFDDPKEWSPDRVKQYKQRGFIAIYMPKDLYKKIDDMSPANAKTPYQRRKWTSAHGYPATNIKNIYEHPLLRKLEDFTVDLGRVCLPNDYTLDLSKY
jgi:hypothetical protein